MIEVKNLVKRYGDHLAVDHLSFTVEDGQIYGFLGPNGAGKSTTMNIMTGYIAATEGQVLINGHDIMEEPEAAKKNIGYLPELPPLYMDMTVMEYLQFVSELKKIPKKERTQQIADVMQDVQITEMADRLIKNLSKGYKQRVGLAQAILGSPEIVILDEPTVGLDPKQIIEIRDLIKELGKKHTVILSSHILSEVSAVCDQIMIISKGKLVANDTPERLSDMATGEVNIHLEIKGEMGAVKAALKSVGHVDYVESNSFDKETGCGSYTVHVLDSEDIREAVFYKMAEQNFPILEMQQSRKSLEDVFLELTKDGADQVPSAAVNEPAEEGTDRPDKPKQDDQAEQSESDVAAEENTEQVSDGKEEA